jgi:signal transduction histidine kinase
MELHDHDHPPTSRMWCLYACAWVFYLMLLGVALQIDDLRMGRVNWEVVLQIVWTLPYAALFALLWPLSGWIERRRLPTPAAAAIHVCGALVLAGSDLFLLVVHHGTKLPTAFYTWPLLYVTMGYVMIATVFHMVRANQARQRQAAAIERAHALLVASELNALRSKLNPHFLFNTLHSIIALTRRDPAAAETALFQFSDMLRYVLDTEKSGSDRVALDEELDFVRDYLELESLRLGPRLNVEWELDARAGHHALPALSLQPLVENSIKHAFNPHSRPGRLSIRTRVDGGRVHITVGDDGPGADPAAVHASTGLGIRTVARRLQLAYGERGGLDIVTAPGAGFAVTMAVPHARA